ncbi:hypothetical protein HY251_08930 [bacterium]|nr:hypothetical protein [bacterium]
MRALIDVTIALLREGFFNAALTMLALWFLTAFLTATATLAIAALGLIAAPLVIFIPPLLVAGPLVVFAHLVRGERLTLGGALERAIFCVPMIFVNALAAMFLAACVALVDASTFYLMGSLSFVVSVPLTLFTADSIFRYIVFDAVMRASTTDDPLDRSIALNEIAELTRGRMVVLVFACGLPLGIAAAASPTPFARDLVEKTFGQDVAFVLLALSAAIGGALAIFLGTALLAAAYAVIEGSPIEEGGES